MAEGEHGKAAREHGGAVKEHKGAANEHGGAQSEHMDETGLSAGAKQRGLSQQKVWGNYIYIYTSHCRLFHSTLFVELKIWGGERRRRR